MNILDICSGITNSIIENKITDIGEKMKITIFIIGFFIIIFLFLHHFFSNFSASNTTELLFSESQKETSYTTKEPEIDANDLVYMKVIPHIAVDNKKNDGKKVKMYISFKNVEGCSIEAQVSKYDYKVKHTKKHTQYIVTIPATFNGQNQDQIIFSIISNDAREIPIEINFNKKMGENKTIKSTIYFL